MVHKILLEANENWKNVQVIDIVLLIRKAFAVEHNITVTLYGNDMQSQKGDSLDAVKAYKVVKEVIWYCAMQTTEEGKPVEKEDQLVDMTILLGHMTEIRLLLDLYDAELTKGLNKNRILRRFSLIVTNKVSACLNAKE